LGKRAEERRTEQQKQRDRKPRRKKHDFTLEVVSYLHFLLMAECHVVDTVKTLRLEEKVPDLPGPHGNGPPEEARDNRVKWKEHIAGQKTQCTEKVQALCDPALMVETVVVPALLPQLFREAQAGNNFI